MYVQGGEGMLVFGYSFRRCTTAQLQLEQRGTAGEQDAAAVGADIVGCGDLQDRGSGVQPVVWTERAVHGRDRHRGVTAPAEAIEGARQGADHDLAPQ